MLKICDLILIVDYFAMSFLIKQNVLMFQILNTFYQCFMLKIKLVYLSRWYFG